jgi:hypothetical protein
MNVTEREYLDCIEEAELNAEIAKTDPSYVGQFYSFPFHYSIIGGRPTISRVEGTIIFKGLEYPTWHFEECLVAEAFDNPPTELIDVDPKKPLVVPQDLKQFSSSSIVKAEPKVEKVVTKKAEETPEQRLARERELELLKMVKLQFARQFEYEEMDPPTEEDLNGRKIIVSEEQLDVETTFVDFAKVDLKLLERADAIAFAGNSWDIPNVRVGNFLFVWEFTRARSEAADGLYICFVDRNSGQKIDGITVAGLSGFGVYGLKRYLATGRLADLRTFDPSIGNYRNHLYLK